jgi:hypothetical protein
VHHRHVGRLDLEDPTPVGPDDLVPLLGPGDLGRPRDRALADAVAAYNPDVIARVVGAPAPGAAFPVAVSGTAGSGDLPAVSGSAGTADNPAAPGNLPEAPGTAGAADLPAAPGTDAVIVADPIWADAPESDAPAAPAPESDAPESDAPAAACYVAFAVGDRTIAGPFAGACPACLARALGEPAAPDPAAALLAGSLAATLVLARIAAGAAPADGYLLGAGGTLRRLAPASIACPHRR